MAVVAGCALGQDVECCPDIVDCMVQALACDAIWRRGRPRMVRRRSRYVKLSLRSESVGVAGLAGNEPAEALGHGLARLYSADAGLLIVELTVVVDATAGAAAEAVAGTAWIGSSKCLRDFAGDGQVAAVLGAGAVGIGAGADNTGTAAVVAGVAVDAVDADTAAVAHNCEYSERHIVVACYVVVVVVAVVAVAAAAAAAAPQGAGPHRSLPA